MKQQIYFEMPAKKYFGIEALSKSGMVDLYQSPHHYKVRQSAKKEPTKSMIFGSALHLAILEPSKYKNRVREQKQKTPKIDSDDIIYLHDSSIADINLMAENVKKDPITNGLLNDARKEVSLFWNDDLGFLCKARIDALNTRLHFVIDIKYCTDASYDAFARQTLNLKYHWQAYWYLCGLEHFYKDPFNFIFICIEGAPSYAIATYVVTDQVLGKAKTGVDMCRETYNQCLESQDWYGYPKQIQELYLPPWA